MASKRKLVFLTGTRADFGKLKSLITITQANPNFEVHIFATGMHLNSKYGKTVDEIFKAGFKNIFQFINHDTVGFMDRTLAKTIDGFSHYLSEIQPDMIIVHGDRVEALAGAIVGSLNNILVAHIEGGEISGTIDELIRHAVSKMSHIHFVANEEAKKRLIQLGELSESVFVIGSPDLDLMNPDHLPELSKVKSYYDIGFDNYAIAMFHPVTTEYEHIKDYAQNFVDALLSTEENFVVVYPNNDLGSMEILAELKRLEHNRRFRIFPSLRFEYFLCLLKNATYIIGNSSAGIREAPFYDVPTIDIGSRQSNRSKGSSILNCSYDKDAITSTIQKIAAHESGSKKSHVDEFGSGNSNILFDAILNGEDVWKIKHQKQFQEL